MKQIFRKKNDVKLYLERKKEKQLSFEKFLTEEDFWDMHTFPNYQSGVPVRIGVGMAAERGIVGAKVFSDTGNEYVIKVSNISRVKNNDKHYGNCFLMSISDNPQVLTPSTFNLSTKDFELVKKFIKENIFLLTFIAYEDDSHCWNEIPVLDRDGNKIKVDDSFIEEYLIKVN